jgi:RNA polymerase primary sigma factor
MHEKLVRSLAENFWAAMVSGRQDVPLLEASVEARRDGQVVMAEEKVDPHQYQPARSRALRAYLDGDTVDRLTTTEGVVATTVSLTVPPRKDPERMPSVVHEAKLLVTQAATNDAQPNRLVYMRGPRMVVSTKTVSDIPLGSTPFQAILLAGHATGSREGEADLAERFLRAAEPPEHNDWRPTEDTTAMYARGTKTRLEEFRKAITIAIQDIVRPPVVEVDDTPSVLRDLLKLDSPAPPRNPGYPTIRSADGKPDADGAWRVRVEIRLPDRPDSWLLAPVLRFATRSGARPEVQWAELAAESNCEITPNGNLSIPAGVRTAAFSGVSAVHSHPVAATMAMAEVDLLRVKEGLR